jgi:hypothetical protein
MQKINKELDAIHQMEWPITQNKKTGTLLLFVVIRGRTLKF